MKLSNEDIIVRPIITEKSADSRSASVYTFQVNPIATKIDIKRAVEGLFNVDVIDVNTINVKGKTRRLGRSIGKTSRWKKAYVKIKEGQKIDLIEGAMQ